MTTDKSFQTKRKFKESEKGAAVAIAIIVLALMLAVTVGVLAVATSEAGISGSDVKRTQTFYASASSIEYMTQKFNALLSRKIQPTSTDLDAIENDKPAGLLSQGFDIQQVVEEDTARLEEYRRRQSLPAGSYPTVDIPAPSPYEGLYAILTPYKMQSITTHTSTNTKVTLQRQMNGYAIPIFQFGIFGDNDIEFHPGPQFTFNGRVHSNRNLYLGGSDVLFEDKVTTAEELVYGTDRNGRTRSSGVRVKVGTWNIQLTQGSVKPTTAGQPGGPWFSSTLPTTAQPRPRGYFPDSYAGLVNTPWDALSISAPTSDTSLNAFNNQVFTRSTGAKRLLLPLQLDGASPIEIIRRGKASDSANVSSSRYYNKAKVRILLGDLPITEGVDLAIFEPVVLPVSGSSQNANALARVNSDGSYLPSFLRQGSLAGNPALKVRSTAAPGPAVADVPRGAGLQGRIKIEVINASNNWVDVTQTILSMGVTYGEPNAIVHLQRPLWSAFLPGSRSRNGGKNLTGLSDDLIDWQRIADGEIKDFTSFGTDGSAIIEPMEGTNPLASENFVRLNAPANQYDRIVPINVYNIREGWSAGWPSPYNGTRRITDRGMLTIVELNMKNLSRWLAGYYDNNLLAGTTAVSTNIPAADGFVVYVSDRRGDAAISGTPNGIVDNENIYADSFSGTCPSTLDSPGEDVINGGDGTMQCDNNELPEPNMIFEQVTGSADVRRTKALNYNGSGANIFTHQNYNVFRRAVRVFNGTDLNPNLANGRISDTNGITVASENMVYIWGNYNTTGINWVPGVNSPNGGVSGPPGRGATTNTVYNSFSGYMGDQIPASIVSDAFFPLSRTWFDALPILFPEGGGGRVADAGNTEMNQETAVRAAIIAGNNRSALAGEPDQFGTDAESRLSGGVHNFPRFSENWGGRWNYTGSLILLYYGNQAMGAYNASGVIYNPPVRNWSFDVSYRNPKKLPPGTPFFQYVEPTNFRQLIDATP